MANTRKKSSCKRSFRDLFFFLRKKKPRKVLSPRSRITEGQHYHLQTIYDALNRQYFNEEITAEITWFGSQTRPARAHRLLGSYDFDNKLIKIHRLLDAPIFPDYFISYVVYHEMLHELFPPIEQRGKKRRVHHPDFKKAELRFSHFSLAKKWEKENTQLFFSKSRFFYGRS